MTAASAAYAVAILAVLLVAGLFVSIYSRYRRDIRRARERVWVGSQVVETPCGPIEYAVAGDGAPLLAVHGAGGGYDQGMDVFMPLAKAGFRVIAMSRFGYLRTPLPADASPAARADAHACLLDALNIRRAVVIGASAGAPSSMQFALRHPERTAALVLMVPAVYVPQPGGAPSIRVPGGLEFLFDTVFRSDFLFWALPRLAPQTTVRTILGTPPAVVQHASAEERAYLAHMIEHILPVSSRRLGLVNDAAITTSLQRYELEKISAPTLIMSVADDLYGTFDAARYSAEHIPHARFVGYPSGGHLGVGHGKEAMSEIAAFLKGVEFGSS
ncbi:MAG: alpha/beta fold hydrolase [Gallionellaceae bacterium]